MGAPTAPEVILRLDLMVKASSCVEPGSSFSDPQCSGKGKCVTQPSEVRHDADKNTLYSFFNSLIEERRKGVVVFNLGWDV